VVIPELIKRYVDTGKVRFVSREFPLSSIHPNSQKAAEAAVCAGKQGKYWEMRDKLYAAQDEWTAEGADPVSFFKTYAKDLGLDTATFDKCLDSGEAAIDVQGDLMAGEVGGVNATPYFFINDLPIRGGLPIDSLGKIIDYVAAGGPSPSIIPSDPTDWHIRGNTQTATAVTVAFVDYANADSAKHAREVLPELVKTYMDSGQLIYILHPLSQEEDSLSAQAAAAAECAGQVGKGTATLQGKYWEMHALLFKEQETWTKAADPRSSFVGYAQSLGLDTKAFEECLDSDWAKLQVESGNIVAAMYGVPATPVFLFNNGQALDGSPTFEEFKTMIDSILNR
jgi:protein-disulfide isomerase